MRHCGFCVCFDPFNFAQINFKFDPGHVGSQGTHKITSSLVPTVLVTQLQLPE